MMEQQTQSQEQTTPQDNAQDTTQDKTQEGNSTTQDNTQIGGDTQEPTPPSENSQTQGGEDIDSDFTQPPLPIIPLEPLPQVPELEPLPNVPITPLPPIDNTMQEIDKAFLQKLEDALAQNQNWKEQVYLTLQGLSRVLFAFESLRDNFNNNYTLIHNAQAGLDEKKQVLEAHYKHFSGMITNYEAYFNDLSKAMSVNSEIIIKNTDTCIKQVRLSEKTLLEVQNMCNDILTYRSDVLLTLEKLKALNEQKDELLRLYAQGQVYLKEIKSTQEQIIQSIDARYKEIKAELESKRGELLTQLTEHKESLQDELEAQEGQINARLEAQIKAVDDKIIELEASFLKKQEALDNTLKTIETLKVEIQRLKNEYEILHQQKLVSLQEATDTHKIALESKKQELSVSLNDEARVHHTNLTELKEAYRKELDSISAAELAQLKTYIEQIQATTTQFGSNFKRVSITSTQNWTPPQDGIYYYVFLQGGTGATNSANSGAPSSFGNYLSVRGGAGSPSGLGLRGECASGFISLPNTNPINVSVGSGGICIISYTQKEAR